MHDLDGDKSLVNFHLYADSPWLDNHGHLSRTSTHTGTTFSTTTIAPPLAKVFTIRYGKAATVTGTPITTKTITDYYLFYTPVTDTQITTMTAP
ncbi:hypothetical protein V5O48_012044 [Marasmius crinis-equi]|uniref:Uncharacterized protein n=1 Tax=Marasmius crinis-equi TaxID=585013 RepID=A0ABR3F3W9_9AGAR